MYRHASDFHHGALRVAYRHLLSSGFRKSAKAKHLKAIDFVLGLIRDFDNRGQKVSKDVSNQNLLRRIIRMREMVQGGFDLNLLVENDAILSGKGGKIVDRIKELESLEDKARIKGSELKAFMRVYPDKEDGARRSQAKFFRQLIIRSLNLGQDRADLLDDLVMSDRGFYAEAFKVVNDYVNIIKPQVSSKLASAPGKYEIRDKEEGSAWDKAKKRGIPFYLLGDLLGCRSITTSVPDMAAACLEGQKKLDVVAKDNKYLDTQGGYNAVHYALVMDHLVVEYQVKAKVSHYEASLSHDLIHSDDKFYSRFNPNKSKDGPQPPSASEEALIKKVVDVSTQLALVDLERYFEMGLAVGDDMSPEEFFLYGGDMDPEELSRRIKMAFSRRRVHR